MTAFAIASDDPKVDILVVADGLEEKVQYMYYYLFCNSDIFLFLFLGLEAGTTAVPILATLHHHAPPHQSRRRTSRSFAKRHERRQSKTDSWNMYLYEIHDENLV